MDPISAISGAVKGVTDLFNKKTERKLANDAIKGKLAQAKINGDHEVTLKDAEWESLSVQGQGETWKDEYVTVLVTLPLVAILCGGVYFAFSGDSRLLDGTIEALARLKELGVDMGELMYIVVIAAVGLKAWRGVKG
jgi:hypothetical protein